MGQYLKNISYLRKDFPRTSISGLCKKFGYKNHVTDIICGMDEDDFKEKYPEQYKIAINEYNGNWRSGQRTAYEATQDVFSNFVIEDLLLSKIIEHCPNLKDRFTTNDEEARDFVHGRPKNLPDFVYVDDNGGKHYVELKRSMSDWCIRDDKFVLKFHEFTDYQNYGTIILHWLPNDKKAMLIDFRKPENLHVREQSVVWNVPVTIISLKQYELFKFDIRVKEDVEDMVRRLDKLLKE